MFQRLFGKPKQKIRALPDRSVREIIDTKERIGSELHAVLYYFEQQTFLVSAQCSIVEHGEPVILDSAVSDETLGLTVCDKLMEYSPKIIRDLSGYTASKDWLVFKCSGAKTMKYFERESIYVSIKTVNSAIQIEASPRMSNVPELKALCSISNGWSHDEIGNAVRRAISASQALRDAGLL